MPEHSSWWPSEQPSEGWSWNISLRELSKVSSIPPISLTVLATPTGWQGDFQQRTGLWSEACFPTCLRVIPVSVRWRKNMSDDWRSSCLHPSPRPTSRGQLWGWLLLLLGKKKKNTFIHWNMSALNWLKDQGLVTHDLPQDTLGISVMTKMWWKRKKKG